MWVACAKHEYISIEGSTMKELIDKMQIITIITYKTLTFPNLTPFGTDMSYRHILQKEWPLMDTVQDQCNLMDVICAGTVVFRIGKLCKRLGLSEKEGWLLYRLKIVKHVLEQGILWDHLFSALLVMDREYLKGTTEHFRHLNENHQATLDFLNNLQKTPEFYEYRFVLLGCML
jgi:hypothetical protein